MMVSGVFVFVVTLSMCFASMWVDIPEVKMNVDELIRYQGYPVENHNIVTEDGYILNVQRIPYGRNGPSPRKSTPVLLQHGLLDSSVTWLINLPKQSLGYILADAGYDVWLSNSRGNIYSTKHVKYSSKDTKYWDFSFDEMAKYDLPACINYILKETNATQINYVGHSQGTTIGFVEFSRNKVVGKKVKKFVALAPAVTVKHIKGIFKYLATLSGPMKIFLKAMSIHQFLPSTRLTKYFANLICSSNIAENACAGFAFLMAGYNTQNLNKTRIAAYLAHTPAGTSVKDVLHFAQMVKSGKFRMYDYGSLQNKFRYGQWNPPEYDISVMETPVAIFSGSHDWLATPQDINTSIRPVLKSIVYDENLQQWNHLDFVWGEDAAKRVYKKIVKMFDDEE